MRIGRTGLSLLRQRAIVFIGCSLLMAPAVLAPAMAAPPVPQACDQADSGERIKCKFNNVVEQQQGVGEMMGTMNMLHEAQQQALMKEVNRAKKAHGRTGATEFKQFTKKSQVECQIQEISGDDKGDDDGICTGGEDCAEVLGDQIGDDDGVCKPRQGKNREACVEICDSAAQNENPANFDDDPTVDSRGRDLEESLDDLTAQYEEVNSMMEAEMTAGARPYPFSNASRALTVATSACETVLSQRPNDNFQAFMRGAADGGRMSADIADKFCNQDAAGFNAAIPCAVIEAIAGVAAIISNGAGFIDNVVSDDTLDATWACLKETNQATRDNSGAVDEVGTDVKQLQDQVTTLDARVTVLDQKVDDLSQRLTTVQEMLDSVILLLQTPQGQRPGFSGSEAR